MMGAVPATKRLAWRSGLWCGILHEKFKDESALSPQHENPKNDDSLSPLPRADSSLDALANSDRTPAEEPQASLHTIFPVGSILESRFRIVRVLGHGGMGEVYEAEDFVLGENIAIKAMLPHFATDAHFRERFRREVLLARKVAHPNVCRIFEVYSEPPSTSNAAAAPLHPPFITMELLHGQTLAQFLQGKSGSEENVCPETGKRRLTLEEALPLISQMLDALRAAHVAEVIHRDFKSSNVFLARRERSPETRVVVTDFGLARLAETDGAGTHSLTGRDMVGTALYMAPEQVEGGRITSATDIYAMGVVMYEMATGMWPFVGSTPNETAHLRLKKTPKAPKELVPSLSPTWNVVTLRCLERDPVDRFQSVTEVLEALAGETAVLRRRTRAQRQQLRKILQLAVAGTFALAGALALYHWWPRQITTGAQTSIAVVRFQNLSGRSEKNWIGNSLEEMLSGELAASGGLRVIPTGDVVRMRQDLVVPAAGEIDQTKLAQIQGNLSVDDLILGDYELSGQPGDEQIRLTLRILNPSLAAEPKVITKNGSESDLFELSELTGQGVRNLLKIGNISAADRARLRAEFPQSTAAERAYVDGLERLNQFDPLSARDFLKDAVQGDPGAPLPHLALSKAWDILGYDAEALKEAKDAQEASGKLSKPQQREIECRVLELQRTDWENAIAACRGVWEVRRRLADGLRLAEVQFAAEKWNDSIGTLAQLRKELRPAEGDDPRVDNAEAMAREALTQYPEMEIAAQSALAKARKKGAKMFEAQALLWSCVARQNLDKLDPAKQDCTTANDIYATEGDRIGQARSVTSLAHALAKLNDMPAAYEKYEEALRLATDVGSARDQCDALLNLGSAFRDEGKLNNAEERFKQTREVGKRSENGGCQARATEGLGLIAQDRRDFTDAIKDLEHAGAMYSNLSMASDFARLQSNFGDLFWKLGEPTKARAKLEDAVKQYRNVQSRDGLGMTLAELGDILLAQDEVDKALAAYSEALKIKEELHQAKEAPIMQIYVAQAQIEKGQLAEAESTARRLAAWYSEKENKDPDNEVFARDVLLRSLISQRNRNQDVGKEAKGLESALKNAEDKETILTARITMARADASQGSFQSALDSLQRALMDAKRQSFVLQEFDANLGLLETAKLQGRLSKADLTATTKLARTASDKGYLLIAKKASALLN
jgi:serine/threonine protein kinase/tetratricopeptide (TPR) repeat protein